MTRSTLLTLLVLSGLAATAPGALGATCPPLAAPVLRAEDGGDGWIMNVELPPDAGYTDILARFDDHPEASTGHEHPLDVMTGQPQVRLWTIVPHDWVTPGEHRLTLRLVRLDGSVDGPHALPFDAAVVRLARAKLELEMAGDQAVTFAEHGDTVTWLFFTYLFAVRDSLREIRYSIDDCSLGRRVVFSRDPNAEPLAERNDEYPGDLTLDRPFITLPKATTRSACVQWQFRDGTLSPVLAINRHPKGGG